MRHLLFTILLLPSLASADERETLNRLLDGFHAAAASASYDDYFAHFSDNAYFLGTDASERWSVEAFRKYAKPAFDAGRGWSYQVLDRNIESTENGVTYWFDEVLMNERLGRCRGTGVLIREAGQWKIAHYSLTLLIPNDIAMVVGQKSMIADGLMSAEEKK